MMCLQFCKEAHSDAVWAQAICDCVSMTLFNFLLVRLQVFDLVATSVQSKVYLSILSVRSHTDSRTHPSAFTVAEAVKTIQPLY